MQIPFYTTFGKRSGFSLVELVIVMAILAVLATIGVMSYGNSLLWAHDTARVADLDRLKIALKSEKQKTGAYPAPGDAFQLINSGAANVAAYQGFFNEKVANNEITKYPTDPETGTHYPYSTTKNRQAFQLATVVEDADPWKAYVEGDYKSVAMNVLPSLMLAMNGPAGSQVEIADGVVTAGSAGSDNRKKFILHGGTANLPYDANGNPVANSTLSFVEILSASGATKTGSARFRTCLEIKEGGAFIGSGEYQVLTESGTVENMLCTGTTFDGACGSANGVPATSVPTSNFCSVGNATAVSGTGGWTWDCVGSDGGSTAHCSADLVSYVVSGSFGTNASGATVSVCGGSVIADSFGNFSKNTVLYWTACDDVVAVRTGYACSTATNGPASAVANVTNVAGSCVPKYPGCDTADVYLSGSAQYWAACNVGAEYAWTGGLAVTDCAGGSSDCDAGIRNTLGSYFQWGRNTDATTLTGAAWPATSDSGSYFYTGSVATEYDWIAPHDDNLWGGSGTTSTTGVFGGVSTENQSLMRGPCADGYHVPTGKEWCDAIASITGNAWCDATAHDDTSVVSTLKLPLSGYRDYSSAAYFNQGIFGHYRTSTPLVSGGTHNVNFSTTQAYPAMASIRGYGFSVRCLKN